MGRSLLTLPITRRRFVQATAAGLATAIGTAAYLKKGKRNVIVIVSDSMRRDALECYGGRWVRTPRLSAFAKTAVLCDKAFLSSFPTVPCRHDLLTGQYTFTFKPWSALGSRTVTLPEVLRSAGMYTALVADTPYPYFPENGYQRGFDHVHIVRGQERDPFARVALPVTLPCNAEKLRDGDWAVTQYLRNVAVARRKVEEDYFSARTLREAAAWLDKSHRRQPFFLFVDTFDPHEPWDPPKSYVDLYDPG